MSAPFWADGFWSEDFWDADFWSGETAPTGPGLIPLYIIEREDGTRVFSTDSAEERAPVLFGNNKILIR